MNGRLNERDHVLLAQNNIAQAALQQQMAQKHLEKQMEALINAEIRQTGREIYLRLLQPYILKHVYESVGESNQVVPTPPSPLALKQLANLAAKCAPYLHQAFGLIRFEDAEHWGISSAPEAATQPEGNA